jgi:hypothetical protein
MAAAVPLSQDETKRTTATRDECVNEIRRLVEAHPSGFITRNRFRVESNLAESAWNAHFGTFSEFRRQAGVVLSRHAHRLERDIAKHASVDRMREMTQEKREYAGRYKRPVDRRWQTALIGSDIHDMHCDPFWRRTFIDMARRAAPEVIVLNGDIYDLPEFSKHTRDPRDWTPQDRIRWVWKFLGDLRAAAPDAEIQFIEGNHEFRLLRHLAEATPAMLVLLADLHGFTVSKLLGLDQFEINLVARSDMTAFNERDIKQQLRRNYTTLWDGALLFGHFPEMRNMGVPGASGHHHKHIVWTEYSPKFGPYEWHQIGCGHRREASYCNGERWANGFLLAHCDTQTKRTQFEYVDVSHNAAMIGGKHYVRADDEIVVDSGVSDAETARTRTPTRGTR